MPTMGLLCRAIGGVRDPSRGPKTQVPAQSREASESPPDLCLPDRPRFGVWGWRRESQAPTGKNQSLIRSFEAARIRSRADGSSRIRRQRASPTERGNQPSERRVWRPSEWRPSRSDPPAWAWSAGGVVTPARRGICWAFGPRRVPRSRIRPAPLWKGWIEGASASVDRTTNGALDWGVFT